MTEFDELFLPFRHIGKDNMIKLDDIFTEKMINKIFDLSETSSDPRFKKLVSIISRQYDHDNDDEVNQYVFDIMACVGFNIIGVTEVPSVLQ